MSDPGERPTESPLDAGELRSALDRLGSGPHLAEAEQAMAAVLPELRVVLAAALNEGGWFGDPHRAETLKAATIPDEETRIEAVRGLLEEETNIGLMVGVAVGWALRAELEGAGGDGTSTGKGGDES